MSWGVGWKTAGRLGDAIVIVFDRRCCLSCEPSEGRWRRGREGRKEEKDQYLIFSFWRTGRCVCVWGEHFGLAVLGQAESRSFPDIRLVTHLFLSALSASPSG